MTFDVYEEIALPVTNYIDNNNMQGELLLSRRFRSNAKFKTTCTQEHSVQRGVL